MKKIFTSFVLLILFSFKVADNRSVYNVPLQSSAVCTTDYDLDGDLDIIIENNISFQTGWGGIYMMKNDGYGYFSYMDSIFDSAGGSEIYTDTVINKAYPDIIYSYGNWINILSNDGTNYTWVRSICGTGVSSFKLGDIDNNGHLDVVFISNYEENWGIIYNQGDSTFSTPIIYDLNFSPTDIACKDLNNDERDDVVITGSSCYIYFSTSSGFETQSIPYSSANVRIADFNSDGKNDIITSSDVGYMTFVHLYENLGNNIFDTVANFNINEGTDNFYVTDFNNDNLPDLLFLHYYHNGGYLLFYNQGGFQFGEPQSIDLTYFGEARRNACCADMDGNSFNDIITIRQSFNTSANSSSVEILFNDGHGNFVNNPLTIINNESFDNKTTKFINYPNPFSTSTTFYFSIRKTSFVNILIYNLYGVLVKSLTSKNMKRGEHEIKWDGLNNANHACKPGPYIAYLNVNGSSIQSINLIIH